MQNTVKKSALNDEDLKKIQEFARREISCDEIYTFNVVLCNNDVDRDFEKFSVDTLYELSKLFVGKTGIFDHSMKASDQRTRIFDTFVEKVEGKKTKDGEDFYQLCAKAYMLNNENNKALIDEIDAGIKKEVSVSCSVKKSVCSICGTDKRKGFCEHRAGKMYDNKQCFYVLDGATDAYEFSFVAVPAQSEAGVRKSYKQKEVQNMNDIITKMSYCTDEIVLSKAQAREISSYIDDLKREAALGEEYKKQLSKEVIVMLKKAFPNVEERILSSVTSVMTTNELLGFKNSTENAKAEKSKKPQLVSNTKQNQNNYSQFKI